MSQLLTGLRVLKRQGLYGLMAVLGLAIGLAVAVTALLFVWQETHFDSHIPDAERVYLIDSKVSQQGRTPVTLAQVPGAFAAAARDTVPGVEQIERLWRQWSTIQLDDRFNFNEPMVGVDPGWVDMMGLEMVSGSRNAFADDVTRVLVSEQLAGRLFGIRDAVGETFQIDSGSVIIGGVFKDLPTASHLETNVIMHIAARPIAGRNITPDTDWQRFSTFTYIKLAEGTDVARATRAAEDVIIANYQTASSLPEGTSLDDIIDVSLQSLPSLHLNDKNYPWGIKPPADKLKLAVFSAISVLIVVIACINHVNMSTVRSIERAREVAIRKIVGAGRGHLIRQFLIEAAILAFVALTIALVLVELSAGFASSLLGAVLDLSILTTPGFMVWVVVLLGFVVVASGLYPAYIASAVYPGSVLSSNARGAKGSKGLRSTLVVFQFAVSITLAIGAAVIWSQLQYARNADLGFDAENVLVVYGTGRPAERSISLHTGLRQAISGKPGILSISGANSTPAWDFVPEVFARKQGEAPETAINVGGISVGFEFFDTLRIEPVAGRVFSEDYGNDVAEWDYANRSEGTLPLVLNQQAVRMLGLDTDDAALGAQLQFTVNATNDRRAEIVGVVPNVHFKSLKNALQPMIYYPDPAAFSTLLIRLDPNQRDVALQSVEEGWQTVLPQQAISSDFLSTTLIEQYNAEASELKTVSVLAGLGILIAIFGQYGLAAYSTQSRRREISIRKVLGARVRDILQLFVWQFSKPVFVAMVVAWPVAFYVMTLWLENFVYRVAPNPLWFVLAGVLALTVALITVAGHALKAARTAPIEALRYE